MVKMTDYAKRRKKLLQTIDSNSIVILPSANEVIRNGSDVTYPFRQNSDFYYLTGFEEPDAVLLLLPKRKAGEYILFNRTRNKDQEIWDGPRAGQEGAQTIFLANEAFSIGELEKKLPELLAGRKTIHYTLGLNEAFDAVILNSVNQIRAKIRHGLQSPFEFIDITPTIHEMRLLKDEAEIANLQKAIDITARGHVRAMKVCHPGLYEYQLEAELMYEFNRHGARYPAYSSIVGAGKNTCVLHYISNNAVIKNGDLVLIDAGAEYQNYAADITRTFPANGRFTKEQRAVYELVLKAQLAAIDTIKPGASWTKMQDAIIKVMTKGLIDLGILKGHVQSLIEKQAYLPFYMHKSGHWLGLDVHDAGRYRKDNAWRTLEPGMVLTVEPGLYFSAETPKLHKRWHNIGVRIEDDVLVTKTGCKVLSAAIPKTVAEIEKLMAKTHATI